MAKVLIQENTFAYVGYFTTVYKKKNKGPQQRHPKFRNLLINEKRLPFRYFSKNIIIYS